MFIESLKIKLRSLEVEDAEYFYRWSGDREVTQFSLSAYAYPQSRSDIAKWLSEINSSSTTISFGIECRESQKLIGYAGISGISSLNRSGEYFILIGDKAFWGKGLGTEVTRLVTNYGFRELGLHRIELTAYCDNVAAIKAYENAGYQHEGIKRESGYRNGRFMDKVQMSVLSREWPAT
ncbi:TPA: GNAT family N-acetyltransferase [Vibrio cholerae]|uniref:GNAT family N-acetyltransferase n=2 Tax=Vibrio cholerae TaxID=666 RepID=UPI000615A5D4|nr:GNAT family protein [Vibrio cholerae]AKB04562.1 acetyltransferase family protein [Vibrio cholerae]EGR2420713.1 N-acetyltransferase [Vibrio cholerae]TXX76043.1 GNAT family N-acetyltransferase [Vibrio cholerae]TYA65693.1 GNAT family N-acetyltransferase [Vibrio cholerae]GIA35510.1 acetyltransferase, putative [Vibrio cholerae]